MNDDKFSLKARRTTRIPLRIPVHLIIREEDRSRKLEGWTMIVNVHGARIECKRSFALHDEVLLQIPSNGKAQMGRVVWSASEANKNGNFEFGLELASPENLWGVGFPPSDWNMNRAAGVAELGDPPTAPAPGGISPTSDPSYTGEQYPAETPSPNQAAEPVGRFVFLTTPVVPAEPAGTSVEGFSPIPENAPPISDPGSELFSPPVDGHNQPSSPVALERNNVWQTLAFDPELAESGSSRVSETAAAGPTTPAPAPIPCETPQLPTVSANPAPIRREAAGSRTGQTTATDRLSAIFNELVESALETRLLGLAERLSARVEARIAEAEAVALAHLDQHIHGVIAAQSERLEKTAVEFTTRQQQLFEQNVQRLLQDAAANALRRQQETLELAETVWANVRQRIGQELPSMETHFVEQCRTQTEQLLASRVAELDRRCSELSHEAGQSLSQRMETMGEENTTRFVAQVEARSELLRARACGQLEQQMEQISSQTRQAFLRHIVTELHQKQQLWLQQGQQELNDLAEQKLQRTRQSLSTVMKEFGEALIRGTYTEVGALRTMSSEISGRAGVPQTERFADHEGAAQPEEITGVVTCHPGVQLA